MQDRTTWTYSRAATPKHDSASSEVSRYVTSTWKQMFRPGSVGLLLLSLAVALFAYGYKVSQYQDKTSQATHFPVAKAVIEHRFGYAPATAHRSRHRSRAQFNFGPDSHIVKLQSSSPALKPATIRVFAHTRALSFLRSALPLRSPPLIAA